MIEGLRKVCSLLAGQDATARGVAEALGKVSEDMGGNLPVVVRPNDAFFSQATVVREYGTGAPAHVELVLKPPAHLSLAELEKAFGHYRRLTSLHEPGSRVIFNVETSGAKYSCAIIASLKPGSKRVEKSEIAAIIVRRDTGQGGE